MKEEIDALQSFTKGFYGLPEWLVLVSLKIMRQLGVRRPVMLDLARNGRMPVLVLRPVAKRFWVD